MLLGLALLLPVPAPAAPEPEARRDFTNPPASCRILKIIHGWPAKPEAQDGLIRKLHSQGFGGVVCNVAFNDGYVESEPNWTAFLRGVRQAREAGMAMWLYDEKGYPSGNAGGIVLREHPELEARGLLVADAETAGAPVALALPPGRLVLAAAFPVTNGAFDLAGRVPLEAAVSGGNLAWTPPAGRWRVLAVTEDRLYEGTHAAHNVYAHVPYVNLLEPEATREFLRVNHEPYAVRLDADLGGWFMATFTDEPSLMSLFLSPMPYRVLPWSRTFAAEFKQRRGYDVEPLLPALAADAGPAGLRARHDFWRTVGELTSENYFGAIQDWCRRHKIPSGGHLLFEESLLHQVASYGDFYRCIRRLDAPSIDMLTSLAPEVPVYVPRLLASAGELTGTTLVMSEASDFHQRYRPPGDARPVRTVTEAEIRGALNRQMACGINCFTSYYSFHDLSDDAIRRLNEWVGRACALLRGGRQDADVAVVYPTESLWVRFVPSRHGTRDATAAQPVAETFTETAAALYRDRWDYTILDAQALADAAPRDGFLALGERRWRVVVLPRVDTLPEAAWRNLLAFAERGGVVIALGARPTHSDTEFPSRRVQAWGRELFGDGEGRPTVRGNRRGGGGIFLPEGAEGLLTRVLGGVIAEPPVRVVDRSAPVRVTHRVSGGEDLYFLINDTPSPWSGAARLRADRTARGAALWRPGAGAVEPLGDAAEIPLSLGPYDAAFVTGVKARPPVCARLKSGAVPGLSIARLPAGEPQLAGAQVVQSAFASDPAASLTGAPAWRVTGTVTHDAADTFLFLRLMYANPLNLSAAELLALDTWAPAGGPANANLLVILCEEGGGEFIADTGRSLGTAGYRQVFVPLERFRFASWSKDADGRLDASRISEIRIGWGGRPGKAGEGLEFTVARPGTLSRPQE